MRLFAFLLLLAAVAVFTTPAWPLAAVLALMAIGVVLSSGRRSTTPALAGRRR
jgi:membrane-bound metal-dependent hydrolase YbcI (DUF457 family)